MNAEDLKALRIPLLVLICVAAIAAGAVYYTHFLRVQAEQKLVQQQQQLKEARTRLQRSGDEKEVIVRYLPAYQQLQRTGFVGEEQRINWLDGLRIANQQADLFGVDYQISVAAALPLCRQPQSGTADADGIRDDAAFPSAARA